MEGKHVIRTFIIEPLGDNNKYICETSIHASNYPHTTCMHAWRDLASYQLAGSSSQSTNYSPYN